MIDAYKVGVTFALNNVVTAELMKIVAQLKEADLIAKSLQSTLRGMGGAASGVMNIGVAARSMGDNFKYASVQVEGAHGKVKTLLSASDKSYLGMGAAFAGYEAMKSGMKMEDVIARAMIAAGLPVGPNYMSSGFAGTFQNSIFAATTGFGVNQSDTQEAALQAIRGLAPLTPDQRERLLPAILNFAGAEVLGKHGTSMEEAVEAGIGLAHQLRAYSPEQIEPLLGAFAKLSMASPASLSQMNRASSYFLPLLTAGLNMDPTELMALGTVGSQMGLNTKSGTWLARLFGAPFEADLTSKREKDRLAALQELGLAVGTKVVTRDPFEFLGLIARHSQGMAPEKRMQDFIAAFGEQGARAATIFTDPAVMKNLAALAEGLKGAPTPKQLADQYGNSPQVKFDKAMQDFMETLTKLGEIVLPVVTFSLQGWLKTLQLASDLISEGWRKLSGLFGGSSMSLVPPASSGVMVPVNVNMHIDGEVIARKNLEVFMNGMSQAPSVPNDQDGRLTPYYPGFAY
jgi:hypothetical protein